jgi:type IX secretion system PorP/SprF family membrane protein
MNRIFVFLLLLIIAFSFSFAQQNPMYTQYMFNGLIINPAYAGSREVINLTALYRNQWYNIDGAPKTSTFSADAPIAKEKIGVGLGIMQDRIGVSRNLDISGYFAYRIKFDKGRTLAMGLSATLTQYSSDLATLELSPFGNSSDKSFANNINIMMPNFGVGTYYSTSKYFIGLSIPTLLTNRLGNSIDQPSNTFARQFHHIFFTAGYIFEASPDIKIKPSILYKFVSGAPMSLDINTNVWFYDLVSLGVSWRTFDAFSFIGMLQATPQIRIGYAYDRSFAFGYNRTGSHEFMLNYMFKYGKSNTLSPRYF